MSKDVCSYSENNLRLKGVQNFLAHWEVLKITNKMIYATQIILRVGANIFGHFSNILKKLHKHF